MDTIINAHMYADTPFSNIIFKMLDSDENLEQIGYGFVTGFFYAKQDEGNKADGGKE